MKPDIPRNGARTFDFNTLHHHDPCGFANDPFRPGEPGSPGGLRDDGELSTQQGPHPNSWTLALLQPASSASTSQRVVVAAVMSIALVAGTMAWAAINPDAVIATDPSRILSARASAAAGTAIASAPIPYERVPGRQAGAAHPASPLPVSGMPTVVARDTELASLDQPGGLAALSDPGAEELRNWVDERLEELRNGRERGLAGREEPAVAGDMVKEKIVVRRGDTLMDILLRAGIPRAEAHEALTSLEEVYDPRKLRVGQHLDIELERAAENPDGTKLSMLSINLDFSNDLRLARAPEGGFDVRQTERELVRHTVTASSVIDNSLYLAARQAGVGDDALMELIRLFSWDPA